MASKARDLAASEADRGHLTPVDDRDTTLGYSDTRILIKCGVKHLKSHILARFV